MKRSTKDKAKERFHEMKGGVKQKVGRMMGNHRREVEGVAEKMGGKVQKWVGELEKVFGK